jgi:flagellin
MRINNNISAMNTYSRLTNANNAKSNSLAKLSSGLRINKAGDDAAGLAISEKMRGQVAGLKQATRNAQDGISLIQTAEGGLNETHSILNRMRELAVQSSNDTNTDSDRGEIQKEMNELATEITRISKDTEFNTQNLLGGDFSGKFHIGANKGQNLKLEINDMSSEALSVSGNGEGKANYEITATPASVDSIAGLLESGEQTLDVVKLDNVTLEDGATANYGLANDKGEIVATSQDKLTYTALDGAYKADELSGASLDTGTTITFTDEVISGEVTVTGAADGKLTTDDVTATASIDVSGLQTGDYEVATFSSADHTPDTTFTTNGPKLALLNSDGETVGLSDAAGKNFYAIEDLELSTTISDGESNISSTGAEAILTSGAASFADGDALSIKADGGIDVSSQEAADAAIKTIDEAISNVSAERSKLGATQNRLDHTINNLTTTAENLTEAESRIRDVDMAEEMMDFTKNNILSQAATSMLAQANQMPQSVLQLLQ